MKQLFEIIETKAKPELKHSPPKAVNERQYLIQEMVNKINKEREGTQWKPVTWRQINGKVAHLKGFELNWFYAEANKRSEFSKYFFGALKKKND